MDRWLLEHDCDEEIYTLPTADDTEIERVVGMFDGRRTFYCCLSDTGDESCLWCVGEPDRRLIEGRLIEGGNVRHFVLRHRLGGGRVADPLRHGAGPADVVEVAPSDVFTPAEVLSIFRAFHRRREIPSDCEVVDGVRLFGANSFGA
ncbi:hypothetical protein [Paludisphaera mucosa]|uniref:Uncharacterized protein n=1 Tax=Paludisphaera mucosa TaxID=3030827 RepID=A0ABT6FBR2_9BACT|nr:hypothetical protein [Paludisphaera mucosa]MDG3004986.1 hypothetical protein [Paludisphaera mucosa]MDG3005361.1 hypothetical protein [Paludisphaera mucosa]